MPHAKKKKLVGITTVKMHGFRAISRTFVYTRDRRRRRKISPSGFISSVSYVCLAVSVSFRSPSHPQLAKAVVAKLVDQAVLQHLRTLSADVELSVGVQEVLTGQNE